MLSNSFHLQLKTLSRSLKTIASLMNFHCLSSYFNFLALLMVLRIMLLFFVVISNKYLLLSCKTFMHGCSGFSGLLCVSLYLELQAVAKALLFIPLYPPFDLFSSAMMLFACVHLLEVQLSLQVARLSIAFFPSRFAT